MKVVHLSRVSGPFAVYHAFPLSLLVILPHIVVHRSEGLKQLLHMIQALENVINTPCESGQKYLIGGAGIVRIVSFNL